MIRAVDLHIPSTYAFMERTGTNLTCDSSKTRYYLCGVKIRFVSLHAKYRRDQMVSAHILRTITFNTSTAKHTLTVPCYLTINRIVKTELRHQLYSFASRLLALCSLSHSSLCFPSSCCISSCACLLLFIIVSCVLALSARSAPMPQSHAAGVLCYQQVPNFVLPNISCATAFYGFRA